MLQQLGPDKVHMLHPCHVDRTLRDLPELFENRQTGLAETMRDRSPYVRPPESEPNTRRQIPIAKNLPETMVVVSSHAETVVQGTRLKVSKRDHSTKVDLRRADRDTDCGVKLRAPVFWQGSADSGRTWPGASLQQADSLLEVRLRAGLNQCGQHYLIGLE